MRLRHIMKRRKKVEENFVKENIFLAQQVDKLTEGLNKCALDLKNNYAIK